MTTSLILSACVAVNPKPTMEEQRVKSEARIALGLRYFQQGNMIKARENLYKALNHAPNYHRALVAVAYYLSETGETASANTMYLQALRAKPNDGEINNDYAVFLCKQANYNLAQHHFSQAIASPTYFKTSIAYENAAFCALEAKNSTQARYLFERALSHDKNRRQSIINLAQLDILDGQTENACHRLSAFQQRFGAHPLVLKLLKRIGPEVCVPSARELSQ
ncbi:type IV pilus biogenesis/stability protein PilW [Vibrio ostreicida]|uniref:type IV pilus biogenesis/stability protein PilW n=1 Tax=Vibrio ostreicida TaxID=526588 RepID=UPI003B5CFF93